jgi:hypothetical protein
LESVVSLARVGRTDVHVDDSGHLSGGGIPFGRIAQVCHLFLVLKLGVGEASATCLRVEEVS